jgi:hypothetical protein
MGLSIATSGETDSQKQPLPFLRKGLRVRKDSLREESRQAVAEPVFGGRALGGGRTTSSPR